MLLSCPSKYILATQVHATSYKDATSRIIIWARNKTSCYVVAANVHVVMTAYWQPAYKNIINGAAIATPDGMPLVWALRLLGVSKQPRVYGPDLMLALCEKAATESIPIYLYGGTEAVLAKLQTNLKQRFPTLVIAGVHSPPFRLLTVAEETTDINRIHASGAAIVFVSLGCPKQEEWMARQQGLLQAVMVGVGAAFSFHSGDVSQSPRWMMKLGLEWLYRFATEPRRLWRRYLVNNPAFIVLFGLQLCKNKLSSSKKLSN
jgi:N-acetylglucosaminyldiphosphoundecaprenol N-acetyl-beta-D-mannosaminyltransferase